MKSLERRWRVFTDKLGVNKNLSNILFKKLEAQYATPKRFYHTLYGHIGDSIREFDFVKSNNKSPVVESALWFHDSVYDSKSHENEKLSAVWAMPFLMRLGFSSEDIGDIMRLIEFTKHERSSETPEEMLMSDIDLSILGKSSKIFDNYEKNIRKEYLWVPIEAYKARRIEVLKKFLDRISIYFLPEFTLKYEITARKNMTSSIAKLLK